LRIDAPVRRVEVSAWRPGVLRGVGPGGRDRFKGLREDKEAYQVQRQTPGPEVL
jgi:hypothetical protein